METLTPRIQQASRRKTHAFAHGHFGSTRSAGSTRLVADLVTGSPLAIDRSPCGTGTSARMAQLAAKKELVPGDGFHHKSIIGSILKVRVEAAISLAGRPAITPSIAGWARLTGYDTIFIDDRDPFAHRLVVR